MLHLYQITVSHQFSEVIYRKKFNPFPWPITEDTLACSPYDTALSPEESYTIHYICFISISLIEHKKILIVLSFTHFVLYPISNSEHNHKHRISRLYQSICSVFSYYHQFILVCLGKQSFVCQWLLVMILSMLQLWYFMLSRLGTSMEMPAIFEDFGARSRYLRVG